MNEDQIKELATQAGFTVTRNMKGPVDVIEGRVVEVRSALVSNMTLARLTEHRKYYTHFAFYMITTENDATDCPHYTRYALVYSEKRNLT